jgi:hypothetical protein
VWTRSNFSGLSVCRGGISAGLRAKVQEPVIFFSRVTAGAMLQAKYMVPVNPSVCYEHFPPSIFDAFEDNLARIGREEGRTRQMELPVLPGGVYRGRVGSGAGRARKIRVGPRLKGT